MKKWVIRTTISLLVGLCLTGCGNAIPELSKEEQAEVCEYAAQLLVRHTRSYQRDILEQAEIEAERERLEKAAALRVQIEAEKEAGKNNKDEKNETVGGDASTEAAVYRDIAEFIGLDGVKVSYAGYEVCDSYPTDVSTNDWQGVCRATKGNKLIVFQYDIASESGDDCQVDIAAKAIKCTFKVNGNINKAALTTMLNNDFIMYRGTVVAGGTVRVVAVIEMPEDDATNLSTVKMKVKYDGQSMETTLF